MKLSKGFWQTYKESPNDAVIPSHKLMIRAGMIQKASGGIYNYLPMGLRAIQKAEKIIREEHEKADCYEMQLSAITPGELWQESGRWDSFGNLMLKIKDRAGRDLCFSPTNEEAITDVFRKTVKSYKQLPVTLYQINTKFRDEIRPRYGLMRGREFLMKDAYSFHSSRECLSESYEKMYKVYENIFSRMGLKFIAVVADGGDMADGGARTHEFQVLAASGEDKVVHCPSCDYAANLETAESVKTGIEAVSTADEMKSVDTPDMATIEDVCKFLNQPQSASLKSLLYTAVKGEKNRLVLALVHGDDTLNEIKLRSVVDCDHLVPSIDSEMGEANIPKGFIGPVGLGEDIQVIYDKSVDLDSAYTIGGMEVDKHIVNFVPSRDHKDFEVFDLRESSESDLCAKCNSAIEMIKGIEVGQVFELGDKYTKAMDTTVLDQNGKTAHPFMGCYGIGVTRTVAAAIEQHNDENGIVWPAAIAPYHVYFAVIAKTPEVMELANEIYEELKSAGVEVVFDDRKAGAGFKFKDADLLGLPVRLVLGERDYNKDGLFEVKVRKTGESQKVKREEIVSTIQNLLKEL